MQPEFVERLPPTVAALLTELESFAGSPIVVEADQTPASTIEPNPDRMGVLVRSSGATIVIRNGVFDPHGALHELLHVRRYWMERIPQIIPRDSNAEQNWQITSQIENALEHLTIVPEEAEFGFEPFGHWNRTVDALYSLYPWPEIVDPWARRKNALLSALSVRYLVTDESVRERAKENLRQEGILKEAWEFARRVHGYKADKRKMLALTLHTVGIALDQVILMELDAPKKRAYRLGFSDACWSDRRADRDAS